MQATKTPVQFTGKGGEYFGIWIVNLLLSIITLGIYSAWAKVRRMKYFYNNTKIDGVGFDFHAKPLSILKGRIIAFLIFVLYAVLSRFSPIIDKARPAPALDLPAPPQRRSLLVRPRRIRP